MVSLESDSKYIQSIKGIPKVNAFYMFLNQEPFEAPLNTSETDSCYYQMVNSISTNQKDVFLQAYSILEKRVINNSSPAPFVHDDFLLFTIICGLERFQIGKKWILAVLSCRPKNEITVTLENMVSGNLLSIDNLHFVIICFLRNTNQERDETQLQNRAYDQIIDSRSREIKDDFIKLCSIISFDTIVKSRQPLDVNEITRLRNFENIFLKRAKICGILIYNICIILILYFFRFKLPEIFPGSKDLISEYGTYAGILGISAANVLNWLKDLGTSMVKIIFGYPKTYQFKDVKRIP